MFIYLFIYFFTNPSICSSIHPPIQALSIYYVPNTILGTIEEIKKNTYVYGVVL